MAKFPLDRRLEDYDFTLQPSLDRRLIADLETGRYLANATNVLLLGPPGVGKTHLAIGLGRLLCVESPAGGLTRSIPSGQGLHRS